MLMLSLLAQGRAKQLERQLNCKMQKVLLALMAVSGNAFAPAAAPRATTVQQGVPLANGAMEFDREAPASA